MARRSAQRCSNADNSSSSSSSNTRSSSNGRTSSAPDSASASASNAAAPPPPSSLWQRLLSSLRSLRWPWRLSLGVLIFWLCRRRIARTRAELWSALPQRFLQASANPPYAAPVSSLSEPLWPTHLLYSLLRPVSLVQHGLLRDSGLFRLLADAGALLGGALAFGWRPPVLKRFARAFSQQITPGVSGRGLRYGPSRAHRLDVYCEHLTADSSAASASSPAASSAAAPGSTAAQSQPLRPVILFVHGGAWGSGFRALYTLFAQSLSRHLGVVVVCLGYRTYPDAALSGQMSDVARAIDWIRCGNMQQFGGDRDRIVLMGHSSGAHVAAMTMIQETEQIAATSASGASSTNAASPAVSFSTLALRYPLRGFVGYAGVFDIADHFDFERARGVHEISPMGAACGPDFSKASPTNLAAAMSQQARSRLPPCLLLAGLSDQTVPYSSSVRFAYALAGALPRDCDSPSDPPKPRARPLRALDCHEAFHAAPAPRLHPEGDGDECVGEVRAGDSFVFAARPGCAPLVQARLCGSALDPAKQDHASALIDFMLAHSPLPSAVSNEEVLGPEALDAAAGHAPWMCEALRTFLETIENPSVQRANAPTERISTDGVSPSQPSQQQLEPNHTDAQHSAPARPSSSDPALAPLPFTHHITSRL